MGFLLSLLVASLLAVGTSQVNATHVLSMPVEPHFTTEGLSKSHRFPENLNYPQWFSMAPLYLPQQNPDTNGPMYPSGASVPQVQPPMLPVEPKYPIRGPVQLPQFPGSNPCSTGFCRLQMFPVEPKYPIGGPVPQVQPPMLPVEPKYPIGGPGQLPQFPGSNPCSTGFCRLQMFPVEPKYPIGGPVPQVQPPMLPVEPKYPIGGPVPQVQPPMLPVEPKYPIGGPVPQVQPPMLPVEPKYPIGGPVPQVQPPMLPVEPKYPIGGPGQLPQFPGRNPCSTGLCRLQMFPVEPKYPVGGPVPQVQPPMLPVEPKYPIGGPVPQVQQPMLPVEPKYPIGGPVQLPQFPGRNPCSTGLCRPLQNPDTNGPTYPSGASVPQVQPPMLPVEPKYPIGGPVPQMQLQRLPGKILCSLENPVGSCSPPRFHANPNYPVESPRKQRLSSVSMGHRLLFNFEPGKDLDQFYHGYPPRSSGCGSKWPFFPSKPCS